MMPYHFWEQGMWVFPILMPLVMLAALYLMFGRGGCRGRWGRRDDLPPRRDDGAALEILKQRYAKGEITKEEFERMKRDIRDN